MPRNRGSPLAELDLEIERTCRKNRKQTKKRETLETVRMAESSESSRNTKLIKEYTSSTFVGDEPIRKPTISARSFEIKPSLINMVRQNGLFHGFPHEDPNDHLRAFLQICNINKFEGITEEAIRLYIFPFTLAERAKVWLNSLPANSITTWDELVRKFLGKYFPPSKSAKLRLDIGNFEQQHDESLHEAFERFKGLLKKCPHHEIPLWSQVQIFYNGIVPNIRCTLDAAAGGALHNKTAEQAWELIEEMATNNSFTSSDRVAPKKDKATGVYELGTENLIHAQIAKINKRLDAMQAPVMQIQNTACETCGGDHAANDCPMMNQGNEIVNFVGNQNQSQNQNQNRQFNNPYSNTYNPGWRNHPNFSWGGANANRAPQAGFQRQNDERRPSTEDMIRGMYHGMKNMDYRMNSQEATLKNLETQMGQLATMVAGRPLGALPSNTEKNPKDEIKAITMGGEDPEGSHTS